MELLRSLIFVPGNRPNMLERALGFNADVVMVDLEDSVPPAEKSERQGGSPRVDSQASDRPVAGLCSGPTLLTPA